MVQKELKLLPNHIRSLLEKTLIWGHLEVLGLSMHFLCSGLQAKRRVIKQSSSQLLCSGSPLMVAGPKEE